MFQRLIINKYPALISDQLDTSSLMITKYWDSLTQCFQRHHPKALTSQVDQTASRSDISHFLMDISDLTDEDDIGTSDGAQIDLVRSGSSNNQFISSIIEQSNNNLQILGKTHETSYENIVI